MESTAALHKQADLLGILHHERMSDAKLRVAIAERKRGADPGQAGRRAERHPDDDPREVY